MESEKKTFVRKYPLPEIKSSFLPNRNPFHENPQNEEWLQWGFELSNMSEKMFEKISSAIKYIEYCFPLCDDIIHYECIVKLNIFFFVFDDHSETSGGDVARDQVQSLKIWGQFEEMLNKLESTEYVPTYKWKPYVFGMYSAMEYMYNYYNFEQKRRFLKYMRHFMEGNIEETRNFNQGREFVNLDEFKEFRIKAIGSMIAYQLIEFAYKLVIPEEVWEDVNIQRLLKLGSYCFCNMNDLFSFEREMREAGDLSKCQNIVAIISRLNNLTITDSMQKVKEMIQEDENEMQVLIRQMANEPNCLSIKKKLVESIYHFHGGIMAVHLLINRYTEID